MIPGTHEGYVSWEDCERIQKIIIGNRLSDCEPSGAARQRLADWAIALPPLCPYAAGCSTKALTARWFGMPVPEPIWTTKKRAVLHSAVPLSIPQWLGNCCVSCNRRRQRQRLWLLNDRHTSTLMFYMRYAAISKRRATARSVPSGIMRPQMPENRLVAQELKRRRNVALEEVQAIESRIAVESECAKATRVGTVDEFKDLAGDLGGTIRELTNVPRSASCEH